MKYSRIFFLLLVALPLIANDFNVVNGKEIPDVPDEKLNYPSSILKMLEQYIPPNELNPHLLKNTLAEKTGTLISVGTFRGLVNFALGDFDRLIMLDIAQGIVDFNREHLRYILSLTKTEPTPLQQRSEYYKKYVVYLLPYKFYPSTESYYFLDDKKWEKITTALTEGRISVVKGNLLQPSVNEALFEALSDGASLTLDVSNILDQIKGPAVKAFYETLAMFRKLSSQEMSLFATSIVSRAEAEDDKYKIAEDETFKYYYFPTLDDYKSLFRKMEAAQ